MGTAVRLVVILALIAAFAAAPLFLVYRSKCEERGKERTRWTFVLPGDDPPAGCRSSETGFDVLRGYAGLD